MRDLSPTVKQHLESGATTLCTIWTLTLRNGTVMGFTDHDRNFRIKGVDYFAETGLSGGAVDSRLGFAVDNGSVQGVFRDDRITATDIDAGLYAGARLDTARVNWADLSQRLKISTGFIGEITRQGDSFTFEWLGESARLDRATGRVFSVQCDADFGDARCGLNADSFPTGTTCPRSFSACHNQFGNSRNFRGFPFLIGDDALTAAPRETDSRDGGSRYTDLTGQ
ncbi:DUF2163 domain-containing protein [Fretibacter rubidus]|uniref:DUF2163 domain-containing protein n=1 Tax=Fretibacter rubidus TaxID=570162 RepID=UPI00352A419A